MSGALILILAVTACTVPLAAWTRHRMNLDAAHWDARQRLADEMWWLRIEVTVFAEQVEHRMGEAGVVVHRWLEQRPDVAAAARESIGDHQ